MKIEKERLLIIAPHADDEILGCYGLIKKIKDNAAAFHFHRLYF